MAVPLARTYIRKFVDLISVFDERSDYFFIQRYFEKLYAIHFVPRNGCERAAWYGYRAALGLVYLTYVHKAYWISRHWEDGLSRAHLLGIVWFFTAVFLRIAILDWHYPLMERLQAFLNDHSYQRDDPAVHAKRTRFYRTANRIMFIVIVPNVFETVAYATMNVDSLEDFMLQYRGQVVGGWPVQVAYIGVMIYCSGIYGMGFMICYQLLSTFAHEIDILVYSIDELNRELRSRHSVEPGKDRYWDDVLQKLRPHVDRLMELFDNLTKLKAVINPFAFVQYYITYVNIAACCLVLATNKYSALFIIYIVALSMFLIESFLLCRGVESVADVKARVADALYDFEWTLKMHCTTDRRLVQQHRHVRRTFLLLTGQADQMIHFSFAGIGHISMNSFSELVQRSYSMLTFLLQFAR